MTSPLTAVRESCERVAADASHVRVDGRALASLVDTLATTDVPAPRTSAADTLAGPDEDVVAYVLTLDAVNFGSGYSPSLENKVGGSLYFTVASALRAKFMTSGPLSARELAKLQHHETATIFPIEGPREIVRTLLEQFTLSLNELGEFTLRRFGGRYADLVLSAGGSADRLIETLIEMSSFDDTARYRGGTVAFYKRAQLTVADLWMRLRDTVYGNFQDIRALTAFADNAVPHVLRTDGVLVYDEHLDRLIARGHLLPPSSEEEVEIRAAAIAAVNLMVETIRRTRPQVTAVGIDVLLWARAHDPKYANRPRHLTQTIFY